MSPPPQWGDFITWVFQGFSCPKVFLPFFEAFGKKGKKTFGKGFLAPFGCRFSCPFLGAERLLIIHMSWNHKFGQWFFRSFSKVFLPKGFFVLFKNFFEQKGKKTCGKPLKNLWPNLWFHDIWIVRSLYAPQKGQENLWARKPLKNLWWWNHPNSACNFVLTSIVSVKQPWQNVTPLGWFWLKSEYH